MIKRGKFQQITKKTKPTKLKSRRGWMVITDSDCVGIYKSRWEAMDSITGIIAIVPVVIDYYVGDGL